MKVVFRVIPHFINCGPYVAGTDPTDAEGVRTCRVWGKANRTDAAWSEVAPDGESNYRFFRVTVEMP